MNKEGNDFGLPHSQVSSLDRNGSLRSLKSDNSGAGSPLSKLRLVKQGSFGSEKSTKSKSPGVSTRSLYVGGAQSPKSKAKKRSSLRSQKEKTTRYSPSILLPNRQFQPCNHTVLVVSSDKMLHLQVENTLKDHGYNILHCSEDSLSAISMLESVKSKLIITELDQEKMGGFELLHLFCTTDHTCNTPIILLADPPGDSESMEKCLAIESVVDVLWRPVNATMLHNKVKMCFERNWLRSLTNTLTSSLKLSLKKNE